MKKIQIRVLFYQEGVRWIAQGIDFDITAAGHSLKDAQNEFEWALYSTVFARLSLGLNPFKIKRAPVDLELKWSQAVKKGTSKIQPRPSIPIPSAEIIRAVQERRVAA